MMAADSGGLFARKKDTCLQFASKPTAIVYLPSLNSLVGTLSNGSIEVYDIHSGCMLKQVDFTDENGNNSGELLCALVEGNEKLCITKGNVIGCRGVHGEKILLDSILQHDNKEQDKLKIELDIVQAGILLNGLQACQQHFSSPKQFVTDSVKAEEDVKSVTEELQRQYEKCFHAVKNFASKSVKWMTVCLNMEKSLLSDAFVYVYALMSRQTQDPSLPIIGDVVRRISLCSPPKKKTDPGRIDRIMMLGEVERLDTFKTWPHKNYEYALPGPMAEAGFYHPAYSTASEDRAICFKCDICLVYWEPSDQPWSEHERHSSSCPFVKGEYTANVPLSICAAVCHAQNLKDQDEKVTRIGNQSCEGLVVVGTNQGNVYLLGSFPLLKLKRKLKRCLSRSVSDDLKLKGFAGDDAGKSSSASSLTNDQEDPMVDMANKIETATQVSGFPETQEDEESIDSSLKFEEKIVEDGDTSACKETVSTQITVHIPSKVTKRTPYSIEIQAMTISKHRVVAESGQKKSTNYIIVGRKCTVESKRGGGEAGKRSCLSVLVINERDMKKVEVKKVDTKSKKVSNGVNAYIPNLIQDPLFQHEFDSYVGADTGELSVINEYLRASKQIEKSEGAKKKTSKEGRSSETRKFQEFILPSFVDASTHEISHLYATSISLFVVVKCKSLISKCDDESNGHADSLEDSSSIDSDTEVIEMPNGTQKETNRSSYILEYRWLFQSGGVAIHDSIVSLREFTQEEYLHDVLMISSKNLGFRQQRFDFVGDECIDSNGAELLLAVSGMDKKRLLLMSTLDLIDVNVLTLDGIDGSCMVEKIVYCLGISVIACCLDDGKVVLCDLEGRAKKPAEEPSKEPVTGTGHILDVPLNDAKLSELLHLTRFEPITNGVHMFLPMDWVVGRASLSANAPLQSKRRLQPHVQDIYPISSPSLLKGVNGISDQKLQEQRLRPKDQNVTFKIFVSSETSIGYIDLAFECNTAISEESNLFVSLYLIEQNKNTAGKADDFSDRELICGPVLLSDYRSNEDCKASLMLTSPKLASVKSSYLALDLDYRPRDGSANQSEAGPNGEVDKRPNKVAVADFISNIQIVIYQFLPAMPDSSLLPSCRLHLIEEREMQRKLLHQLVIDVYNGKCLGEDSEGRKCLEIFLWIWHILTFAEDSLRSQIVEVAAENVSDLIKACFVNGDRTLAHRVYQLLVSICRYSVKLGHSSFAKQLLLALTSVVEEVANFSSVGALRWFFRLCNAAIKYADPVDLEGLFASFLISLVEVTRCYQDSITSKQLMLQTRFDLVGSPLEPIIAEPVCINLVMGENVKTKPEPQNGSEAAADGKKTMSVAASEVPGILEVHQLGFTCVMTSEGSKCEAVTKSSNPQSQSLKVSMEHAKSQFQEPAGTSPPYPYKDEDLPFFPFYDDLNNIESEMPDEDYIEVDQSVYEVLDKEGFDMWNSDLNQRKAKVVKKRGRSARQEKPPDIDNEFIVPESMLLVVERMHAAAQHFAIIDFQRPIYLTDVLIPPCASLASLSVYAWKENQTEKEAVHVVTSNEIGRKALILTDMIPSVKCKYLKVIANGSRKLNSTKISISLGNFYGRPVDGTYKADQLKSRLQQEYDRAFCRYALACDRLSNAIEDVTEAPTEVTDGVSGDLQNMLIKAYSDCAETQLNLNHVFHSLKFYQTKSKQEIPGFVNRQNGHMPNDFMRVLIECFLETLLLSLQNIAKSSQITGTFEMEVVNFDNFLELFKNLCVFGPLKIRQLGCTLVQCLCEIQPWWDEFLINSFKYCFESSAVHGVPKNRLFILFMRILKTASDRNRVIQSLTDLLNDTLAPLCKGRASRGQLDLELVDLLLLVFNELLQHFDQGDWVFLTPWNAMAKESSGLETRTQEQIRDYLQAQRQKLTRFNKRLQILANQKKKHCAMGFAPVPIAQSSSKELKDLLLLRRHPLFSKRRTDHAITADALSLLDDGEHAPDAKTGIIKKQRVLPTLTFLFKLMLACRTESDFERLLLTCKIGSMLILASDLPIHITEIANFQDLTALIRLAITSDSHSSPWINHAILCFIRQILLKKQSVLSNPVVSMGDDTGIEIPVSLDDKEQSSASGESSSDSSETMSGQEGEPAEEKLMDIASSIATNLMKVIKESVHQKEGGNTKDNVKFPTNANRYGAAYSTYHLVDGFDKGFQMEGNQVYYENLDRVNQILAKGVWEHETLVGLGNEIKNDSQGNSDDLKLVSNVFAKIAESDIGMKNINILICQWIAITSTSESFPSKAIMQLPFQLANVLLKSNECSEGNKHHDFLCEKAMVSSVMGEDQTKTLESLLGIVTYSSQIAADMKGSLRSLSLLKVLANVMKYECSDGDTASGAERSQKTLPRIDKKVTYLAKTLILEILRNERNDSSSCQEMLQLVDGLPIFDEVPPEEVEITSQILKLLSTSIREFVSKNKELLILSFLESNNKQKRLYIVDKGRHWQIGKCITEQNHSQLFKSVTLLENIVCPGLADSQPNKILYCQESAVLQDIFEVLFLIGEPPIQHESRSSFPACFLPRSEIYKDASEFHDVVQSLHRLLVSLARHPEDRQMLLEEILLYIAKKDGPCSFISKAVCSVLANLLQTEDDIEFFINKGGLSVICDRVIGHAEVLEWSSNRRYGLPITEALTEKDEPEISGNKTRPDIDGSELKNLAPCGRVISPPNSPPADILLQSKPNHRRSRFAAWSYQFNNQNEEWVPLTIELPFAILLKQIVLYHHASFLGNCPAEVYVEIKGCGDAFVPYSPTMQTSGLQSVYIQFARGLPAKAIRLYMKRPLDSEVIKVNNIELYGKAALSSSNRKSSKEFSKRFYWIELLNHVLEKNESSVEKLSGKTREENSITKALLQFFILIPSCKPLDKEILLSLLVKIFSKNFDEWMHLLSNNFVPRDSKSKSGSKRTLMPPELASILISAVMRGIDDQRKTRCLSALLDWASRILHRDLVSDQRELHTTSIPYFRCITNILAEHVIPRNQVESSLVSSLSGDLLSVLSRMDLRDCRFRIYSKFFTALGNIDTVIVEKVISDCFSAFNVKETFRIAERGNNCLSIAAISSQNDLNNKIIVNSTLPLKICEVLQDVLKAVSGPVTQNLLGYLSSMFLLLKFLIHALQTDPFKNWFGSPGNCSFLGQLIHFLSVAYLDKGLLVKDNLQTDRLLGHIHRLQSATVTLVKRMVSFHRQNQLVFIDILKSLLSKECKVDLGLMNNSFLKRLVLQVILDEEEVVVQLKRRDDNENVSESPQRKTLVTMENMVSKRLRLSDSLSSLFPVTNEDKAPKEERPKQPVATNEPSTGFHSEDWFDDGDWNDGPSYSVLFATANSATQKRQQKQNEASSEKGTGNELPLVIDFYHPCIVKKPLSHDLTIGQVIYILDSRSEPYTNGSITLFAEVREQVKDDVHCLTQYAMIKAATYPSLLRVFAMNGGIQLLANHKRMCLSGEFGKTISVSISFLLKFVQLSGFSDMLLKEPRKAEYLLRLMLGVEHNSDGDSIACSSLASDLPLLPFVALQDLFKSVPLKSDEGRDLRKAAFDNDVIKHLLSHLGGLCYQETSNKDPRKAKKTEKTEVRPSYWARGTGFGTGSTASTWDVEKVIQEKRKEEDHVVCLLRVLASYIDPMEASKSTSPECHDYDLPEGLALCFEESPLRSVLSSYLRNDSVLDMARHVPLFMALMEILRAIASKSNLVSLLLPKGFDPTDSSAETSGSISQLLSKLKDCANTYISRLKGSKKRKPADPRKGGSLKKAAQKETASSEPAVDGSVELASEALTVLIGNIRDTSILVEQRIADYEKRIRLERNADDNLEKNGSERGKKNEQSLEEQYMQEMKTHQFDTYEFIAEEGDDSGKLEFLVPFHYAETLRTAVASGDFSYSSRSRRLAQEIASLSTSLPLSFSSSVFLRCDENRLDIMKVLITGPEDTPYANGCFEFDIYFPRDYPTSPMMVNLQTTGQHSIRFNPNLYNDGKVCLSILNTWHGRPEEKWNPQTSNLLQVLVSIQSLILVPDPYFNEPGYERSRGTPIGQQNSMDYNANIKQATIKWAMLEQLRNPAPCFRKLIRRHFVLKKAAILKQCEAWVSQIKDHSSKKKSVQVHYEAMKRHFSQLKTELDKLTDGNQPPISRKELPPTPENLPEINEKDNLVYV